MIQEGAQKKYADGIRFCDICCLRKLSTKNRETLDKVNFLFTMKDFFKNIIIAKVMFQQSIGD